MEVRHKIGGSKDRKMRNGNDVGVEGKQNLDLLTKLLL